jgi:phosphatidylglycerophosphatase C
LSVADGAPELGIASPPARSEGLAIFDLDGTLTRHDTLLPYLRYALARHPERRARLGRVPGIVARFLLDRDRGRLKGELIHALLGGLTHTEVQALTLGFLDEKLIGLLNENGVAAVEAHRNAGDWLVLLSASTEFYVRELGSRLGFDEVICTEVRWDGDRLDGRLKTGNRRGTEKARCIAELRAMHPGATVAAYGNATSDLEHLCQVDAPRVVNPSLATRRQAAKLGLQVLTWR